jgi:hypothetical protein
MPNRADVSSKKEKKFKEKEKCDERWLYRDE